MSSHFLDRFLGGRRAGRGRGHHGRYEAEAGSPQAPLRDGSSYVAVRTVLQTASFVGVAVASSPQAAGPVPSAIP